MPQFKPFKGIRASEEYASNFVLHSIDSYSKKELETLMELNNHSFLQIVKPTFDKNLSYQERYEEVKKNYDEIFEESWIKQDKASFYIYEQQFEDSIIQGIIGLVSLEDYENQRIKTHEETLKERRELFAEYLKSVHVYAEPVLLMHKANQRLELIIDLEVKKTSLFEFTEERGITHKLWMIKDRLALKQIKDSIEAMNELYIADGHHRMASSYEYYKFRRENEKQLIGSEYFNYTMAFLVSENQLIVKDFNRIIKDLNGLDSAEFLNLLQEKFIIMRKGDQPYFPNKKHHISMYLDGIFYGLYVKPEFRGTPKGLGELDTFLFEQNVLKPLFNIHDSRHDKRIDFIKGTGDLNGVLEMKNKVDNGDYKIGFAFFPINTTDLELVADLGLKMPPKSTYIEPKLLSGLVMLDLNQ